MGDEDYADLQALKSDVESSIAQLEPYVGSSPLTSDEKEAALQRIQDKLATAAGLISRSGDSESGSIHYINKAAPLPKLADLAKPELPDVEFVVLNQQALLDSISTVGKALSTSRDEEKKSFTVEPQKEKESSLFSKEKMDRVVEVIGSLSDPISESAPDAVDIRL